MNEQLKQFNLEHLKAMAYDTLVTLENLQKRLSILNQEIANRSQGVAKQALAQEKEKGE